MDDTTREEYGQRDWKIVIPRQTRRSASILLWWVRIVVPGARAVIYDPNFSLELGLDRHTAQLLRAGLYEGISSVPSDDVSEMQLITPDEARRKLVNVIDDIDTFIENGHPYDIELRAN